MSNCVRIDNTIEIPNTSLDLKSLRKLLFRAENLIQRGPSGNATGWGDGLADEREAWWFLCGSLHFGEDSVKWTPGRGCRSSHSWWDLYSTILTLRKYILVPTDLSVKITDTDWDDSPASWMTIQIVKMPCEIPTRFTTWGRIPLRGFALATEHNEEYT